MENRQLAEATAQLDVMRAKFQKGQMGADVVAKLVALAQACGAFDFKTATKLMQDLATMQWNDVSAARRLQRACALSPGRCRTCACSLARSSLERTLTRTLPLPP